MKTEPNYIFDETNAILKTVNDIVMNVYTNASFSNMDVVFISKQLYETYLENLSNLKKEDADIEDIEDIDKVWKTKIKQDICEESVLNSVFHVTEGRNDCIIYDKSNLVIMNKNYYSFLNEVFEYNS